MPDLLDEVFDTPALVTQALVNDPTPKQDLLDEVFDAEPIAAGPTEEDERIKTTFDTQEKHPELTFQEIEDNFDTIVQDPSDVGLVPKIKAPSLILRFGDQIANSFIKIGQAIISSPLSPIGIPKRDREAFRGQATRELEASSFTGSPSQREQLIRARADVLAAGEKIPTLDVAEAETRAERLTDVGAGVTAFIAELAIARRILPTGTSEPLVWEVHNQLSGGIPGEGAAMALTLGFIGKIPAATLAGKGGKLAAESAVFAGLTAVQGGGAEEVLISMSIPPAMKATRGFRKALFGAKVYDKYINQHVTAEEHRIKSREAARVEWKAAKAKGVDSPEWEAVMKKYAGWATVGEAVKTPPKEIAQLKDFGKYPIAKAIERPGEVMFVHETAIEAEKAPATAITPAKPTITPKKPAEAPAAGKRVIPLFVDTPVSTQEDTGRSMILMTPAERLKVPPEQQARQLLQGLQTKGDEVRKPRTVEENEIARIVNQFGLTTVFFDIEEAGVVELGTVKFFPNVVTVRVSRDVDIKDHGEFLLRTAWHEVMHAVRHTDPSLRAELDNVINNHPESQRIKQESLDRFRDRDTGDFERQTALHKEEGPAEEAMANIIAAAMNNEPSIPSDLTTRIQEILAQPAPAAEAKGEIDVQEEKAIIEPTPSPEVQQREADVAEPIGKLDPAKEEDARKIVEMHQGIVGQREQQKKPGERISAHGGITELVEDPETKAFNEELAYSAEQVDAAYRTVQKQVESPFPDTELFAMPGKEAQMIALGKKMAKQKKLGTKKKGFPASKPHTLPKAKLKQEDIIKAVTVARGEDTEAYSTGGLFVDGDKLVATDGQRMFIAKGDWGKSGLYLDIDAKKGTLGKLDTSGAKFPAYETIIPDYPSSDAIVIDDLETVNRRLQQASLLTTEETKGVVVILNEDGSLGFASQSPEVGHVEINVKQGGKILGGINSRFVLEALAFHAQRGDKSIKLFFPDPTRPLLTTSIDGKTQTVTMPINIEGARGADAPEAVTRAIETPAERATRLASEERKAVLAKAPEKIKTRVTQIDKDLMANDNEGRFVDDIILNPNTAQKNLVNERQRLVTPRPGDREFGATTIIPDLAAEVQTIGKKLYKNPIKFTKALVDMSKRNLRRGNNVIRTYGNPGRKLAEDIDKITFRITKKTGNDLQDMRDINKGLTKDEREIVSKIINGRIDTTTVLDKLFRKAQKLRAVLDRAMNDATDLDMKRKVKGKKIPVGGSGKAYPQAPNDKGVAFLEEANAQGRSSPSVFAWAQIQVQDGKYNSIDEAISALQSFRESRMRGLNTYLETERVELPEDMIEWDGIHILPHTIERNWTTIEGVREWGEDFGIARSRIEQIRKDFGPETAARVQMFIETSFGIRSGASHASQEISRQIRGYQFISKVGLSIPTIMRNMFDRIPKGFTTSGLSTIKTFAKYPPFINQFIKSSQKHEDWLIRSGAVFGHGSISEGYEAGSVITELLSAPFSSSERGNQVFIAMVQYDKMLRDLSALKGKDKVTKSILDKLSFVWGGSEKQLKFRLGQALGEKALEKALAGEELSQEEIAFMLHKAVRDKAFPMIMSTKPLWYDNHPFIKIAAQFKTWPVEQTKMIWNDVLKYTVKTGDFTRLIRFAAATMVAGELYNILRDFLFDKDESILSQYSKDPEQREIAWAIINDLLDGGVVGMIADFTYGLKDWVTGVSARTGKNVWETALNIKAKPRLTPQALERLLEKEVTPYRQIKRLVDKADRKFFNEGNISKEYYKWRAEGWKFFERSENPTILDQVEAYTDKVLVGVPDYGVQENTLALELAARQVIVGDIDDAAKYLRIILSDSDDVDNEIGNIRQSKTRRSPLGRVKQEDRFEFLKDFSLEKRKEALEVQAKYDSAYERALLKAQQGVN